MLNIELVAEHVLEYAKLLDPEVIDVQSAVEAIFGAEEAPPASSNPGYRSLEEARRYATMLISGGPMSSIPTPRGASAASAELEQTVEATQRL